MATSRMTLDELKSRPSVRDRSKIAATSEADIRRQMVEDGENPEEELAERDVIWPWFPQTAWLVAKGVCRNAWHTGRDVANWEQNRVAMEPATVALMRILPREPEAALRALRQRAA